MPMLQPLPSPMPMRPLLPLATRPSPLRAMPLRTPTLHPLPGAMLLRMLTLLAETHTLLEGMLTLPVVPTTARP